MMTRPNFTNFVGVDQTGAYDSEKSKYKPLKICHWDEQNHSLRLGAIPSFSARALLEFGIPLNERTLILVDSVFGLPNEVTVSSASPWDWFELAAEFSEYGRTGGETYFNQMLSLGRKRHSTEVPARAVELKVGANSLFRTKPYQKNIQTGSFRIWQDLGNSNEPWLRLWPFESPKKGKPVLAEGYPSLLWRDVFGMKSRQPKQFESKLVELLSLNQKTMRQLAALKNDPDLCDSAVLAFGALIFLNEDPNYLTRSAQKIRSQEGWIFGSRL